MELPDLKPVENTQNVFFEAGRHPSYRVVVNFNASCGPESLFIYCQAIDTGFIFRRSQFYIEPVSKVPSHPFPA
ncbi:MAG: hypothetical protein JXA38_07510 [Methanosarcinaceae archaeon]|nr:hypothetical protein [Methanosarcinaceae archaeon]